MQQEESRRRRKIRKRKCRDSPQPSRKPKASNLQRKFGEMLGFKGIFVDSPNRPASAWQEALTSDRPVVIEVKTDPEVVPLPPHLTLKQARGFVASIVKGDEGAGHIISETAKQVVDGLFGKKE